MRTYPVSAPATDLTHPERARLDDVLSSYEFHRGIESPRAFLRREWRTVAVCGGVFVATLAAAIFIIDPAFFYPRIATDPMLYYLKGRAFAHTGSAVARIAINERPYAYVAMPGVLRSPLMILFPEFDTQLRAIQITNLAVIATTAVMYAYILSWTVPLRARWMTIPFSFAFFALNPYWISNVFNLLGDAPYAALTVAVIILFVRILCTEGLLSEKKGRIALAAVLFTIAFFVKFTAPLLLLYGAVLGAGRARSGGMARRTWRLSVAAGVIVVLVLVIINGHALVKRYLTEPLYFMVNADKPGMMMNLIASAIPSQIIPNFVLAYARQPLTAMLHPVFGTNTRDQTIVALGIALTVLMFVGIWRLRRTLGPEVVYFLTALPVLAAMIPGTIRYLMPYQPFIWSFFLAGLAWIVRPAIAVFPSRKAAMVAAGFAILLGAGSIVYVRFTRMVGTASTPMMAVSLANTHSYVDSVARTFRDERTFLERLPRDRTLLISDRGSTGRWTVIRGLEYYWTDANLPTVLETKDVYVLSECGTVENCQDFELWDRRVKGKILDMPEIAIDSVFATGNRYAKVRAYKLRLKS